MLRVSLRTGSFVRQEEGGGQRAGARQQRSARAAVKRTRMHVERRKALTAEGAERYSRDKSEGKQKCMLLCCVG